MSFLSINKFESTIAGFFGSKFCVATDCCTHAVELSLRLTKPEYVICPTHTYISIPFTLEKLGLNWGWTDDKWIEYYHITNRVIDAAVLWRENSYIQGTLMCISFQYKKHLNLGRGGCVLLDNKQEYELLKKMSYDGRSYDRPWSQQDIKTIGYHYYMTPETAQKGIDIFPQAKSKPARRWSYEDYPYLKDMSVFK